MLPNEIYYHIFNFVSPITLFNLYCTNKIFQELINTTPYLKETKKIANFIIKIKIALNKSDDIAIDIVRRHCTFFHDNSFEVGSQFYSYKFEKISGYNFFNDENFPFFINGHISIPYPNVSFVIKEGSIGKFCEHMHTKETIIEENFKIENILVYNDFLIIVKNKNIIFKNSHTYKTLDKIKFDIKKWPNFYCFGKNIFKFLECCLDPNNIENKKKFVDDYIYQSYKKN